MLESRAANGRRDKAIGTWAGARSTTSPLPGVRRGLGEHIEAVK